MKRKFLIFAVTFLILNVVAVGCIKSISENILGRILFLTLSKSERYTEIWEVDINGKNQNLLSKISSSSVDESISSDGKRILYIITKGKNSFQLEESKIILKDIDTDKEVVLTKGYVDVNPCFSPDGKKIAFSSKRDGEDYEVYIMDIEGRGIIKLTDNELDDYPSCWSPDGEKIIFTSRIPFI